MKSKYPLGLILTDTHLSEHNIELVTDIWKQAIKKCQELRINYIFFGGDFFTSRKGQSLLIDNAARNITDLIIHSNIELIAISGNHDKVDLNSEISYLDEYIGKQNISVYKHYDIVMMDEICFHLIPYFKESIYPIELEKAVNYINEKKSKEKNILITHIAVNGVKNNDGSLVETGVQGTLFKAFDKVFVGHYHNQSQIGDNIFYIGSAYQANFGEDDRKGFTIVYSDGSHELIQSQFPKFIKLTSDISDTKKIKEIQKEHANSKDHVRIVLTGDETQLASLNKEKFNAIGIDVKFEKETIRQDLSAVLDTNINFNRSNIKEAFEQFCKLNEYQDSQVGQNYLEKL